ncbi:hypothetical protein ACMD2_03779 [Ananas comosus]|uniref:Uncharacterized protein n=1 Tax=Ananas comosus TaxID=4615 RepID=A0A199V0H7_ANACO|nr:hypothetical protein ACMD2_03779 [Ananas comosus]
MASLLVSPPLPPPRTVSSPVISSLAPLFRRNPHHVPSLFVPFDSVSYKRRSASRTLVVSFALAESDSPKSLGDEPLRPLLQELADSLRLPPDFLSALPGDLRLDLNDAAFDLSNGPVLEECGKEVGELLLNLSRAWELADTRTSNSIATQLPSIESYLMGNVKSALGKRLVSAGRRFEAMGQYGQGELQRIAKTMVKTGKSLSRAPGAITDEEPKKESKTLKFGEIEFELTPAKANIGAAVGFVFGILSWELSQGVQSIPESSLQYANDNALILAKSLRGALLVLCYSSTFLSAFASVGLLLLARQVSSERDS